MSLWFESLLANCDPAQTGLCFVVPSADFQTRDVIDKHKEPFAWCEVIRDKSDQFDRRERLDDKHFALALARNTILREVHGVNPKHFLSWDSDLLIDPGVLPEIRAMGLPLVTIWTWLNRQRPKKLRALNHNTSELEPVLWQEAMCATAMEWDGPKRARHYHAAEWDTRASGLWRCDVALAFQLMSPAAYCVANYSEHIHGEDIPFNWRLEQRGVPRWCYGDSVGVHLFDREQSQDEIKLGYPAIMGLAQDRPLASVHKQKRNFFYEQLGFFPIQSVRA